jgi:AmiR/NasT family two-component response regulator
MALHGIDGEEAFRRLAHISQHTNTKLHDVARDLLRSCTGNL